MGGAQWGLGSSKKGGELSGGVPTGQSQPSEEAAEDPPGRGAACAKAQRQPRVGRCWA